MMRSSRPSLRQILCATALICSFAAAPVAAQTLFTPSADGFIGQVSAASPMRGTPVLKGGKAVITGNGLPPGQEITLMRGTTVLNADGPLVADAEGKFAFTLNIDPNAETGLQPIVVIAENPAAALVVDLKISPDVPVAGADHFDIQSVPLVRGLYQVAYSPKTDAVFVTSAVGRPPVKDSELLKVDAKTLEVLAKVSPAAAPAPQGRPAAPAAGGQPDDGRPGVFAIYGIGVDDSNGTVWVTNTRQNTVAVYAQADLKLLKQFAPDAASHARDVLVDEKNQRVYVTSTFTGNIEMFDAKTLEQLAPIVIKSAKRGGEFSVMALDLDTEHGKLATVSQTTDEAAIVDLATGEVTLFALPGAKGASGVAFDAQDNLLFIAAQSSDNVIVLNALDGTVIADTEVGAGPLNVTFEPKSRLAYIANRGAGTITVVDTKGEIVANLDAGSMPNQLRADGKGNVFAVNKSRGENDEVGDRLWKITPKAE